MNTFDTLILGGMVYDGRGGEARRADVALRGDRIADVAPDLSAAAPSVRASGGTVLDAAGLALCPGFIDAHSHSDAYLLLEPSAASKLRQGVTTEITGNCGASAAPWLPGYELPSDWAAQRYPRRWTTVADYRDALSEARPAVNSRLLAGHRTVRAAVMGAEPRAAAPSEIRRMAAVLERAMDEGAAGLSTGLVYAPAMFASRDELVALARVAASRGGLYATHMRSEGSALLEAVDEALAIGRESGAPVQISHLKTAGKANWHKLPAVLDRLEAARAAGQDVAADRYPYCASCTDLDIVLPEWAEQGGRDAILARLRDPAARRRIRDEMAAARPDAYWTGIRIGFTRHAGWQGRLLADLAAHWDLPPLEALLRLVDEDGLGTMGIFPGMSEDNRREIWRRPWVMGGSDASIRAPWGPLGEDFPHPRAYGTFGKIWREARDGTSGVSPGEAVRKCTSLPARRFDLADRGEIRPGAFADVLLFDPAAFADAASYEDPHRFCAGLSDVWVNGVRTLAAGRDTGARAGRYLD